MGGTSSRENALSDTHSSVEAAVTEQRAAKDVVPSSKRGGDISVPLAGESLLKLDDVHFKYAGQAHTLAGLSFEIRPKEVVAVVGPSGCGKSTLLALVAGLLQPTGGMLTWVEGSETGDVGTSNARVGAGHRLSMMFQKDTVLPWRSVERNVAFGMENLKVPKRERQDRVNRLLAMGGLSEFRHAQPRQLSGGMRRRLALLMSLSVEPSLLLLDEPFAAVDEPTRVALHADVLSMVYSAGTAVMLVTHDLAEAISLADRIVMLTARPARVAAVHGLPFGHERDVFTIRQTPEYADLYSKLWAEMWSQDPGLKERQS